MRAVGRPAADAARRTLRNMDQVGFAERHTVPRQRHTRHVPGVDGQWSVTGRASATPRAVRHASNPPNLALCRIANGGAVSELFAPEHDNRID